MQQPQKQFHTPTSSPVFQQETHPLPEIASMPFPPLEDTPAPLVPLKVVAKKRLARIVASVLALLLAGAVVVIWFLTPNASSSSSPANITQQSFGSSSTGQNTGTSTPTGGPLHVYVTGAVKNPGVYILPAGARVYQLLQAAGGAKPQADLVALNLAAPLTDGEEVYVLSVGESPPTYQGGVPGPGTNGTVTTTQTGQPVNLNTATIDQMRQVLHVSSATAQKIIDYRTQHGPYTSVDQLLQVVSRSIYDKIKNSVTV